MYRFNIPWLLLLAINFICLVVSEPTYFGNQTHPLNDRDVWYYYCPTSQEIISFQTVLNTIDSGIDSIFNHAGFSDATRGSHNYPHIFDTRRPGTPLGITVAIANKCDQLPSPNSIVNWRDAINIIMYPILPRSSLPWQPGRDPGAYRLLAERDPYHPYEWRLCAVIAHLRKGQGFELCDELFRPRGDALGITDHIASLGPYEQPKQQIIGIERPWMMNANWQSSD